MDKCWKPGKTTAVRGCALTLKILPRKPNLIFKIVKSQCGTDITTVAFSYNHKSTIFRKPQRQQNKNNLAKIYSA